MYEDYYSNLTKKEEQIKKKIQKDIFYCSYCQPYDGGDCVWIYGRESELMDLFDYYEVPEKSRKSIAHNLSCPNCGHSDFEEYERIGLEDDFDNETRSQLELLDKKYKKEIDELMIYISNYPTLALNNKLGRRISKDFTENKMSSIKISGKWFRARVVSDSKVYKYEDLHVPQLGVPGEGRYNHAGQNFLYLARYERTAISEVLRSNDDATLVWVQEYENVELENILDLRSNWDELGSNKSDIITALLAFRILEIETDESKKNYKPEYYITRFISDLARNFSYNGIIYNSAKTSSENVVIFYCEKAKIVCSSKPRVVICEVDSLEF